MNAMHVCLSVSTIFNVPVVQYGLRIRLMEFRIEKEICELKRMDGNIRSHTAVLRPQTPGDLISLIKNCTQESGVLFDDQKLFLWRHVLY